MIGQELSCNGECVQLNLSLYYQYVEIMCKLKLYKRCRVTQKQIAASVQTAVRTRVSVLAPTGSAAPAAGFETPAVIGFTVAVGVADTGFVGRGGAGGGRVGISPDALASTGAAGGGEGVAAAGGGEGVAAGASGLAAAGAPPAKFHTNSFQTQLQLYLRYWFLNNS